MSVGTRLRERALSGEAQEPPLKMLSLSAKDRRSDRQLRLWAADGQRALEETWVILVNNGPRAVGIETLKNLILPGIGRYTILDEQTVQPSDLGLNFFLTEQDLGQPRAIACARLLNELNPDVQAGYWTRVRPIIESHIPIELATDAQQSLEEFVQFESASLRNSLVIIAGPISNHKLLRYDALARDHGIPLVHVQSSGFYGQLSTSLPRYFPIVDSHPDINSVTDLRILNPWPELEQFARAQTQTIDSLSDDDHGHIPFILILLHYVAQWRAEHNGSAPSTYAEKTEFREQIRKATRTHTAEGGEENFEEAVAAVLKALNPPSLPSSVRDVFASVDDVLKSAESRPEELPPDPPYASLHGQTKTRFWEIARAVRTFYKQHGALPLSGAVPDMKARSSTYVALQKIYKQKARDDVDTVLRIVRELESTPTNTPQAEVSLRKEVEAFCKSALAVKVIEGRSLPLDPKTMAVDWQRLDLLPIYQDMQFNPYNLFHIFLCFHMAQLPTPNGSNGSSPDASTPLKTVADELRKSLGDEEFNEEVWGQFTQRVQQSREEMARAGDSELHNIAAVLGGMAAQEVIKIITRQYVPIDNVMILDGIQSRTQVFRL